jgi:F-box and leucine-rich repeat protein GRR1
MSQRNAFCVYSGKGVSDLRAFLTELFNTITEDMNHGEDDTEYDDDYDDLAETTPDAEMETGNEGDDDEEYDRSRTHVHHSHSNSQHRPSHSTTNVSHHPELVIQRDRTLRASSQVPVSSDSRVPNGRVNGQTSAASTSTSAPRRTTARVFGQQPVVEMSTSPAPSDVASNRSTGTNQSNGAFFRTYQEAASSSRSNGALTPDLIFAEIGHGRGANNIAGQHMNLITQGHARRGLESMPLNAVAGPSSHGITQAMHSSGSQIDVRNSLGHDRAQVLADSSNSYRRSTDGLVTWPHVPGEIVSPSSSPTTRELHESVQSAFGISSQDSRGAAEGRGRRVKRSLRNTISAAENYASAFLFGRGSSNGVPEGNVGWSNNLGIDGAP